MLLALILCLTNCLKSTIGLLFPSYCVLTKSVLVRKHPDKPDIEDILYVYIAISAYVVHVHAWIPSELNKRKTIGF